METPNRYWFRASRATLAAIMLTGGFILLAVLVVFVPAISAIDMAISNAVQSMRSSALDQLMVVSTSLGDSCVLFAVAILICVTLLVLKRWRTALILTASFAGTSILVTVIKQLLHRARPISDLYLGVEAFSFPSGHMTNAVVIYGTLALLTLLSVRGRVRFSVTVVIAVLIVLIGVSRIYLGAHWPSDVVGGGLLGAAILCLMLRYLPGPQHQLPSPSHLGLIAGLTGLVWAIHLSSSFIDNSAFYAPRAPIDITPEMSGPDSPPGDTIHGEQ